MNYKIKLYLKEIEINVKNTLMYLQKEESDIDKNKIENCLFSINKMITNINKCLYSDSNNYSINKEYLINYLYYIEDKVDKVYKDEINKSVNNFINNIKEDKMYE